MQVPSRPGSDQRVADAIRVAPYLTHIIRHHGQLTLIPPDNAGRVRKPKREKRPRTERAPRENQEPQFNVGVPRSSRRGPPASPAGRGRQERRRDESDGGVSIPDYPPPSFDEAVSAATSNSPARLPAAVPASTPTSLHPPPSPSESQASGREQPSPNTIPPVPRSRSRPAFTPAVPEPPSPSSSLRYSTQAEYNDSDSDDSSIEIVSRSDATSSASEWEQDRLKGLSLKERLAREHEREQERQTVKKKASSASVLTMRPSPSVLTLTPPRGGDHDRDQVIPPSPSIESENGTFHGASRNTSPTPFATPKRRLHLFSGRNKSKEWHPVSLPSSPTFASSQLSLPLQFFNRPASPNARTGSSPRAEGLSVRKLFGHKGKEKSVSASEKSTEPLEAWELLDEAASEDEPPTSPDGSQIAGPSRYFPPAGRLAHSDSVPHLPVGAAGSSLGAAHGPTRPKRHSMLDRPIPPPPVISSRSDQRPAPPPPTSSGSPASPVRPHTPQVSFADQSLSPPHVSTTPTRDLRASPSMVWSPAPRFPPPQSPSPTTTVSPSPISVQSGVTYLDYGPGTPSTTISTAPHVLNGVRRRVTSGVAASYRSVLPPPADAEVYVPRRSEEHENIHGVIHAERPGPAVAVVGTHHRSSPIAVSGSPTRAEFINAHSHSRTHSPPPPLTSPIPMGDRRVGVSHQFSPPTPSPLAKQSFDVEATPPANTLALNPEDQPTSHGGDRVVSVVESLIDLYDHSPLPMSAAMPSTPISPSHIGAGEEARQAIVGSRGEPGAPPGHHYPGRPLPRPPGAASTSAIRPLSVDLFVSGDALADEKKAITFGVAQESNGEASPSYTPSPPPVQVTYAVSLPSSPPVDADRTLRSLPLFSLSPSRGVSPPRLAASSTESPSSPLPPPSPASVFEQPELRTPQSPPAAPAHSYAEYTELDALLSRLDEGNSTGDNYESLLIVSDIMGPAVPPRHATPPVGRIEVVRRRVTKDGRVKLKLSLLGIAVDRCGICLSQFKDRESAALGTQCQHAFHEHCLRSWLVRNQTCPLCRAPFA